MSYPGHAHNRHDGKILSLKVLDQKGFESHIVRGHIHIMKGAEVYMEASLGGELYEVKMKIVPSQESGLAAVGWTCL